MIFPFHFLNLRGSGLVVFAILFFLRLNNFSRVLSNKKSFPLITLNIILLNCSSLVPFTWSITSYLWNSLNFSLILVLLILFRSMYKNSDKFFFHLLPLNSPLVLWDLLTFLEIIRNLIRPITLSLRLTCNIITGHVLLTLIIGRFPTIGVIGFLLFESVIRIIQSHVYSMLIRRYTKI